jgi:uncharacterized protein (TIGR03086 family)
VDVRTRHQRCVEEFARRVDGISSNDWDRATPCTDWNVRDLVNHVTGEYLWIPPLLAGSTIAEVGDRFDGDVLGDDPAATFQAAVAGGIDAIDALDDVDRIVHLSFGDVPAGEYLRQMAADSLVHAWDLAVAIGADDHLDKDLVADLATWFDGVEELYRAAGVIGPRVDVPQTADAQTALLARFGRPRNGASGS